MGTSGPLTYAEKNRGRFVSELKEFIGFPSVSAQPKHVDDLKRCAEWLASHLRQIGLKNSRVIRTRRHPIVYADWAGKPGAPTVLIYGHYDVQPPEPLKKWDSPPFTATVCGENLHGRGACDDKGQMFAHVKALQACLQANGSLPVNVKCLFEGEEEIGSPNLHDFIARHRNSLAADAAIVSDMPIPAPDQPAITYAVRGGLSIELEVQGPNRDLHSGIYGGAVHNPLEALSMIIAKLHGSEGSVAIPDFYRSVRKLRDSEHRYMVQHGPTDTQLLKDAGTRKGWGEHSYSAYERTTIRPALTVNGITGGYQGVGSKGVIPSRALAKLSFRLVPDQDPQEVEQQLRSYIREITPNTVRSKITAQGHAFPVVLSTKTPAMRAAIIAYRKGFGAVPTFLRCGGTIPVVNTFRQTLGIPAILMGFALPDDRMHAPNEKFHLPNFYRGIATSIYFLHAMKAVQPGEPAALRELAALSETLV